MVRGTDDCYITSAAIPVTELLYHCTDVRVRSTAAVSVTVTVEAFDIASASLGTYAFAGNTRGASVFDRHVACLYAAGSVATPGTFTMPDGAVTATIKIELLTDGATIYVDCCYFGETEYIPGHVAESIFGLVIPDAEGDLPAPCEMTLGSPFAPPIWATETPGIAEPHGVYALDATHVWVVGINGEIWFYNGFSWTEQTSGISSYLLSVTAFNTTHQWAVSNYGNILFGDGSTWTPQTYPAFPELANDGGLELWTDANNLTKWSKSLSSGYCSLSRTTDKHGGTYAARFTAATESSCSGYIRPATIYLTPIEAGASYTASAWVRGYDDMWAGDITYEVSIQCFNGSGTYLGTVSTTSGAVGYYYKKVTVAASSLLSGTVYIGVRCRAVFGTGRMTSPWVEFDDISLKRSNAPSLCSVHAIAANNIIAVGAGGAIVKSADGTTWAAKTSGVTVTLRGVHASDATHIYAVGDDGTILFSADGETWTPMTSGTTSDLYGVWAYDATHVWAVGQNGTILFYDGTTWTAMTSGVVYTLQAVDGVDATHVWVSGNSGTILVSSGSGWIRQDSGAPSIVYGISILSTSLGWAVEATGTVLRGIGTPDSLALTILAIGERDNENHDDFHPVLGAPTGTLAYNIYRYGNCYRILSAGETIDFIYNLLAHAGNQYAVSAGISFSASTAYDKGTLRTLLQTIDGVVITSQYAEDEVDLGDPNTVWKESLLLSDTWDDTAIASHVVHVDALLNNIDQIARLVAHASLAAVKLWVDHLAIVPTDRWLKVNDISSNYLIINSSQSEVFDSKDGGPSTAMTHDPTDVDGTPHFYIDPAGTNMTVLGVNTVTGDMRMSLFDLTISWRPRTKLYFK